MNNKPSIDFNKAWDSLKPELDKEQARREKKKRRFIIFWFTAVAIAIGSSIFLVNNKYGDKSIAASSTKEIVMERAKNIELVNKDKVSNSKANASYEETDNLPAQQKKSSAHQSSLATKENKPSAQTIKSSTQKNSLSTQQIIPSAKAKKFSAQGNFSSVKANKSSTQTNNFSAQQNFSSATNAEKSTAETSSAIANTQNIAAQNLSSKQQIETNNNEKNNELQSQNNSIANNNKSQTTNVSKQATTNKKVKSLSYGLQFNLPVVSGLNTLDANAENNIAAIIIPTIWINKTISKKQSLQLFVNPYANYYASNKAIINNTKITTTTQQATQNSPQQNNYTQTIAINKLIGFEAGLLVQHQIKKNINVGVGISYFATQSMLFNNVVIKNNTTIKNDIYSVGKNNTNWQALDANFLMANFEVNYQFKKLNAGLNFTKPLYNIFNNMESSKTPINTNLFIRWRIN